MEGHVITWQDITKQRNCKQMTIFQLWFKNQSQSVRGWWWRLVYETKFGISLIGYPCMRLIYFDFDRCQYIWNEVQLIIKWNIYVHQQLPSTNANLCLLALTEYEDCRVYLILHPLSLWWVPYSFNKIMQQKVISCYLSELIPAFDKWKSFWKDTKFLITDLAFNLLCSLLSRLPIA